MKVFLSNVKIVPVNEEDPAVAELIQLAINDEIGGYYDERHTGVVSRWGVYDLDKLLLIGLCGIQWNFCSPQKKAWISYFAVHPDYQRNGIGTRMLEFLEEKCREKEIPFLFAETYKHPDFVKANNFYQKNGFRFAGYLDNYLVDGSMAVYYMKEM